MNGLRRCAYCSSSRLATISAPNAALRGGLIGIEAGVGTALLGARMDWAPRATGRRSRKYEVRSTNERSGAPNVATARLVLDVKFLGLIGAFHDEPEARRRVLSH